MKRTQGRRRDDCQLGNLPPDVCVGDYWKIVHADGTALTPEQHQGRSFPSNLCGTCWMIAVPNPASKTGEGYLLGNLVAHTVRENVDRTISVLPGDGSSNSILVRTGENAWHGYVYDGVLEEC